MAGWRMHRGTAIVLARDNIDTDQLIPARFMSTPRSAGYGAYLLYDLRRDAKGGLLPDFPLNGHEGATVLVAGRNFGSGSSREAAVYALVDAGVRAVIAPGFGDIFAANAVNNGLLPARIRAETCAALQASLGARAMPIEIDLNALRLEIDGKRITFDIDDSWKIKLMNGWDDIDLTRSETDSIVRFRNARKTAVPWSWPGDRARP